MRIYADTSFLVELLYKGGRHHASARRFFEAHPAAEWVTSSWSQFETFNTFRQLCLANPGIKSEQAEALRRTLKHWHTHGNFTLAKTSMDEAVQESQQLSVAAASKIRMRGADVLHVALLEQIEHDLFVTRDKDQYALSLSRAFRAQLLP